jgi:glutaconate CoA-transferase subunit A
MFSCRTQRYTRRSSRLAPGRGQTGLPRLQGAAAIAEIVGLADAVAELVDDGAEVALEGFSHLVPVSAGHELIRQGRRDLTVVRMVPDVIVDQMIGMGCVRTLVFSWAGNPGVGSLHRFRDAVENGWPGPLALEEHTHAGLANRYVAGASGLPFAVLRAYSGTDLLAHARNVREIECPFTGRRLAAVAALRPDVSIVHAQRADRRGNVQLWGITGVQKEAILCARRSLVTVEEIVDELLPVAGAVVVPSWTVTLVAEAPGGAHPTYADGYSRRANAFFGEWDAISRDRDAFGAWMRDHVLGAAAPARA